MTIAITGITGNMGKATLDALEAVEGITELRLLVRNEKRAKKLINKHKTLRDKIKLIVGGTTDNDAVHAFVTGADLVVNMAAVIPPRSDKNPRGAIACNEHGVDNIVTQIESADPQPALVHISTVALYGNRNEKHPLARVGDPLLVSPYDVYSATKLRGEFRVLESDIARWTVLRQSAMLHPRMLTDNISDGLMFHTCMNAPLEWVTAHDSGVLVAKIVQRFIDGSLPDKFFGKCFDIVGGKQNRSYGVDTFDLGFDIIGGSGRDFFEPWYNATRNFHGVWYADPALNDMFGYLSQTMAAYWRDIGKAHPVFKMGKIMPKKLIKKLVIDRLLKDDNAPAYWAKHGDDGRIIAMFGSVENYNALKSAKWDDIPQPDRTVTDIDENPTPINYGFDFDKPDENLTQSDLESVAAAHGGKLIGEFDGDMYVKLEWETQDGERFFAKPYTVLRAGHWYNRIYREFVWDFDRLAKNDKIYASLWYDSHATDENYVYSLDDEFGAHIKKVSE